MICFPPSALLAPLVALIILIFYYSCDLLHVVTNTDNKKKKIKFGSQWLVDFDMAQKLAGFFLMALPTTAVS